MSTKRTTKSLCASKLQENGPLFHFLDNLKNGFPFGLPIPNGSKISLKGQRFC